MEHLLKSSVPRGFDSGRLDQLPNLIFRFGQGFVTRGVVRGNGPEGDLLPLFAEEILQHRRNLGKFVRIELLKPGVEIRLEVHGRVTCEPPHIRTILDHADSDNVFACWNSNMQDRDESGSIDANYRLLEKDIHLVHITELWSEYPWGRLFKLLNDSGYDGFTLAEIPESADAVRLMKYYRALWLAHGARGR